MAKIVIIGDILETNQQMLTDHELLFLERGTKPEILRDTLKGVEAMIIPKNRCSNY